MCALGILLSHFVLFVFPFFFHCHPESSDCLDALDGTSKRRRPTPRTLRSCLTLRVAIRPGNCVHCKQTRPFRNAPLRDPSTEHPSRLTFPSHRESFAPKCFSIFAVSSELKIKLTDAVERASSPQHQLRNVTSFWTCWRRSNRIKRKRKKSRLQTFR